MNKSYANTCIFLLLLSLTMGSCSSDDNTQHYAEMQSYYTESANLDQVAIDSVSRFNAKVQTFVRIHPDAKEDALYPKILKNISLSQLRFKIYVDDEWDGEFFIEY